MKELNAEERNKRLTFLYQLMPRYYNYMDEGQEKAAIMDLLEKAILKDTGKNTTIKTKLKRMEFDVERYPEKEIFIFYLTYLQFIRTNRPFIKQAHRRKPKTEPKQPNQKLSTNVIKFDVDYSFRNVGIQFLIAYELYNELEKKVKDDKQFIESYNDFLVFMHLQLKEFLKAKGNDTFSSEEIEEMRKVVKGVEDRIVLGHVKYYHEQEEEIKKNSTILHLYIQQQPYPISLRFAGLQLTQYYKDMIDYKQEESWGGCLYTLLFYLCYFFKVCEALTMRIFLEDEAQEESLRNSFNSFFVDRSGDVGESVGFVREMLRTNILLDFAGKMFYQQGRSEYLCQIKILEGLLKESEKEALADDRQPYLSEPESLDDNRLNTIKPEELLDLMIPEKSQRPEGIRNTIKKKVANTIRVLERLKGKYGIIWDARNSNYVRAMYEELYQYNEYHYKNAKGYSGVIKHMKAGTASPGELLLLKEKQIRGLFRMKNALHRYPAYVEEQTISLESAVQVFASFEHWMES